MHIKPFLKVRFPGWVVGIGFCTNLRVSFNPYRGGCQQAHHFCLPFVVFGDSGKHPAIGTSGWPVFLLNPPARFVAMPSLRPGPEGFEDFVIDSVKNFPAYHVTVVQGPSTDLWIEFCDQFSCRQVSAFLDVFSDLGEKCLDILLRWRNEEFRTFPFLVLAYRLS
jgi:hypothetical protein